jgi:hypothetical protein
MKLPIAAAVTVAALVLPAAASADYTISKAQAQWNARDAARALYGDSGVTFNHTSSTCRPQGVRYDRRYTYHRWVCGWAGYVGDGTYASGLLRITGHTGDTYGYLTLRGIHFT